MKPARPQLLPLSVIDWKLHVQSIGSANRALARYGALLERLPNPELLLSPLTVQEAVLSSRIEGTFATMSEVLQSDAGAEPEQESKRLDIEEINRYRSVLRLAESHLQERPFGLRLLLEMHRALLTSARGSNKMPGAIRKEQNYIGTRERGVERIRFTPPRWEDLPAAISNWENYYHAEEQDPLVQLGVVHAQFEFLHPFLDGNGRIGRILIPIFLYEKQLLSRPMFYLSEYIEAAREEYVDRLHALGTRQGWNDWCAFFLKAISAQADTNARKANDIFALYEELKHRFISATRSPYAVPLLDAIFLQPIFRAGQLELAGGSPSRVTTTNLLKELVKDDILEIVRHASGQTGTIYRLSRIMQIAER